MKYSKKIGNNRYVRCAKCGMKRNLDEAPKCPNCDYPAVGNWPKMVGEKRPVDK